jgi:glycosyltransferase involved in cell wall biosynthesis
MKIGLLGPTYPFRGGIAHYTTLLFRHLKKTHDVKFISFKRQYPAILFPGRTDKDDSNSPLKEPGVEYGLDSLNPFTWRKVANDFLRWEPDILVIPWWVTFWVLQFWYICRSVKKAGKTKILFLCHNVVPHETGKLDLMGRKLALGQGDYFIVHSDEEADQLRKLIPGCLVKRTFHPTYGELNTFEANTCKKELSPPYSLLFFGFVREYKGLKYLIRAIAELKGEVDIKLTVAGEFWEDIEPYQKLIMDLDVQEMIEIIDRYIPNEELGQLFCRSDLVVLPYISVTGSGALQLALGLNKPVITSAIGSLKEVVIDGFNGFAVPPKNPSALAEAIKKVLRPDTHARLIENIEGDKYRFSWDKMVETIEDFHKE